MASDQAAKPRLTLVEEALADAPNAFPGVPRESIRKILAQYAPSISKRARAVERQATLTKVGAATLEEISSLPHLRASFEREEAKHAVGNRWRGRAEGGVIALALVSLVFVLVIRQMTDMAYEQAQRATQNGAFIGAAAANQDPAQRGHDTPHMQNSAP